MAPTKAAKNADETAPATLKNLPPTHAEHVILSYPLAHILLVTLNRPEALNAINFPLREDLDAVFAWFETEPDLWVAVVTGNGRAFCAGADLKAWKDSHVAGINDNVGELLKAPAGFASLSRRISNKPIIAAVNGQCMGGGTEVVVNCDLVIASEKAKFGLPEPSVGVVAAAGAIPRLVRIAGHQRAAELLLTGNHISAEEARDRFGFVNEVVPHDRVVPRALEFAKKITSLSPDSIRATKRGINDANLYGSIEDAWRVATMSPESYATYAGQNILEGLKAFNERRVPKWTNPKL